LNFFPSGKSYVNFEMGDQRSYQLVSGFIATTIDEKNDSISPYIGWYIRDINLNVNYSDDLLRFSKIDVPTQRFFCCF